MPRRFTLPSLLLAVALLGLFSTGVSSSLAATRTTYALRAVYQLALGAGSISTDGYETSNGYPAAFSILSAAVMSAAFGETDYASTFFVIPDWNFITGSSGIDQNYCAGCNGSFRLSFTTASEICSGSVLDGVFGVGFDIESHSFSGSPAGPYSAFVTYGDGTTENFNFPAGASFFGITSPDLINNIHVAVNNVPTGSGSITIDNMTLGNSLGGCSGAPAPTLNLTKTANPSPAIAGQNLTYTVTATNNGAVSVNNVVITDTLPSNARFVSSAPSASGICLNPPVGTLGGTVVCSWTNTYAPGTGPSVNIVVGVCPDEDCTDTLTNRAIATFDQAIIIGLDDAEDVRSGSASTESEFEAHEAGEVTFIDGIPHTESAGPIEGAARSDVNAAVAKSQSTVRARQESPDALLAPGDVIMWGAASTSTGELYLVDPDTAGTTFIGEIGFQGVTGLEVLPDGRLVGSAHDGRGGGEGLLSSLVPSDDRDAPLVNDSLLLDIDRGSGSGTLIGAISNVSTG